MAPLPLLQWKLSFAPRPQEQHTSRSLGESAICGSSTASIERWLQWLDRLRLVKLLTWCHLPLGDAPSSITCLTLLTASLSLAFHECFRSIRIARHGKKLDKTQQNKITRAPTTKQLLTEWALTTKQLLTTYEVSFLPYFLSSRFPIAVC